ncbi:RHS repeat-associated core domain-containing protein [Pseudomonas sp. SDO55104_S430]
MPSTHNEHHYRLVVSRLLATDQQRSVLAILAANQPERLRYTPYGHNPAGSGLISLLAFNGEQVESITGWYLLGNGYRAFNPVLMRFIRPDSWSPFGRGGLNTYAYCAGNPVSRRDPSGHFVLSALMSRIEISRGVPASGLFGDFIKTIDESMRLNADSAKAPLSAPRQHISDVVSQLDHRQPFIEKLQAVNENLASNDSNTLSLDRARKYGLLAQKVSEGSMSNSGAHGAAAMSWMEHYLETRRGSGLAGSLMNIGGMFASAPWDHANRVTGKAIRRAG